jgi:hypothetical protein
LIDRDAADEYLRINRDSFRDNRPDHEKMKEAVTAGGADGLSLDEARILKMRYEGLLAKLRYETEQDQYVLREQVDKAFFACARRTRDAMQAIPDRIAGELASITDIGTVRERLTAEIHKALTELTNGWES